MHKPQPQPVDPSQVRSLALNAIKEDRFPYLATMDGDQPRVRPVSPLRNDDFTIWVASLRDSHKTGEIEANAKVELCYMTQGHDQVRLTGLAHTITDRATKLELWEATPLLRMYLPNVDDPQFVLYRIETVRVRFMREWALEYFEVPIAPSR
ncbi:MAG: pyridoxamine 5'-phosphate oxidase family protein [Phycisphaeraceae bacterium]